MVQEMEGRTGIPLWYDFMIHESNEQLTTYKHRISYSFLRPTVA